MMLKIDIYFLQRRLFDSTQSKQDISQGNKESEKNLSRRGTAVLLRVFLSGLLNRIICKEKCQNKFREFVLLQPDSNVHLIQTQKG